MIPLNAGWSNQWLHVLIGGIGLPLVALPVALLTEAPIFAPLAAALAPVPGYLAFWVVEYSTLSIGSWRIGQWPISTGSDHPIDSAFHFVGRLLAALGSGLLVWGW